MIINPQEQYKNKETGLWHDVLRKYATESKYQTALDIGTASGLSAYTILKAGDGQVVSVGDKGQQGAQQLMEHYELADRISFIQAKSHTYWEEHNDMFDFISIDGSHDFNDVYEDAQEAWKRLNAGGYIVFDDYAHIKLKKDVGVAVDKWAYEEEIKLIHMNGKAIAHKE